MRRATADGRGRPASLGARSAINEKVLEPDYPDIIRLTWGTGVSPSK